MSSTGTVNAICPPTATVVAEIVGAPVALRSLSIGPAPSDAASLDASAPSPESDAPPASGVLVAELLLHAVSAASARNLTSDILVIGAFMVWESSAERLFVLRMESRVPTQSACPEPHRETLDNAPRE